MKSKSPSRDRKIYITKFSLLNTELLQSKCGSKAISLTKLSELYLMVQLCVLWNVRGTYYGASKNLMK